jgi:hypothetical protein
MAAMASNWLKNWKSLKIFFRTIGYALSTTCKCNRLVEETFTAPKSPKNK